MIIIDISDNDYDIMTMVITDGFHPESSSIQVFPERLLDGPQLRGKPQTLGDLRGQL